MMEYFIDLLPWYMKVSTLYYIISAGFYFLMWFFKRPISVFISDNLLQLKLHAWFGMSMIMPIIHYSMISNGFRSSGEPVVIVFYWGSTIVYVGFLLFPIIHKLRAKVPDARY
ncbi:hypothetical protein UES1_198 [Escherichia phage UE-S1]|nr:hypothetical protein UES1_198 [Escherichia phage UE-S1]